MTTYVVTFEATVSVVVEADDEADAEHEGRLRFTWTDVEIDGLLSVDECE